MTAFVMAALLAAAPALDSPPKPLVFTSQVEGVYAYALPNGLQLVLVPDPSAQKVTLNLTVFVGSRNEGYGEKGMAHLLEHLMFKGTPSIPDPKKELTLHADDGNATTSLDRTNYYETVKPDDVDVAWAIRFEADRLVNARLEKKDLDAEMTVVRNEWENGENEPGVVLNERLMAAAYSWHNYAHTTIGPRSDIELVPIDNLRAFYRRYYRPDNAMLVVAGKLDAPKVWRWVTDSFGKIPKPKTPVVGTWTQEPVQDGEKTVVVRRVGGVPMLEVGYHVAAGSDPDFAALDVLSNLLGDAPTGRLYSALVETKKASAVSCSDLQQREPGMLICSVELKPGDPVDQAKAALLSTLEQSGSKPFTEAEVERAKVAELKDIELVLNDTNRIGLVLTEAAAIGDWRLLYAHRDHLRAVNVNTVNRVAARYLKASNRTLGEYVPTEKPDRSDIPGAADLAFQLKDLKGDPAMSEGEAFEATPAKIEARVQRSTLDSGLALALLPKKNRGQRLNLVLALRWGTLPTLQNQQGVAELSAQMLDRGTTVHDRKAFQAALDKLNALVTFIPIPQGVAVTLEVRKPQLAEALKLVAEALMHPAYDPKEFETLQRELLTGIEQQKNDPVALGSVLLQRAVSPLPEGHPLYVPTFDEQTREISAVKVKALSEFHDRFYGINHAQLAVVGDLDPADVTAQVKTLFNGFVTKAPFERIAQPYLQITPASETVQMNDKTNAFYGAGVAFQMRESDPDYPAMLMADFILGGGFLTGRITHRLRETEGLSYSAGTVFHASALDDNATELAFAIYKPQNLKKIETGFQEELKKALEKGFTAQELKDAIPGLLHEREQQRGSDPELAQLLVRGLFIGRDLNFEAKVDQAISKLDAKQVSQALQSHLKLDQLWSVRVGDFGLPSPKPPPAAVPAPATPAGGKSK